jgi:uncharacterized protein with PIN domain
MDNPDHKLMDEMAIKESRVIVTRDKKFFSKRYRAPCFILVTSTDTGKNIIKEWFRLTIFRNCLIL